MYISGSWSLLFVVTVSVVLGFFWLRRLRRRAAEARLIAKQEMLTGQARCHARVHALDMKIKLLRRQLDDAVQSIAEEAYYRLYEQFEDLVSKEDLATRQYEDFMAKNRESLKADLRTHEYEDKAAELLRIIEAFDDVSTAHDETAKHLSMLLLPENTSRVEYARSLMLIAEAAEVIERARTSRYRVAAADGYLQQARRAKGKCETNLAAKNYHAFAINHHTCCTNARLASESAQQAVLLQIGLAVVARHEANIAEIVEAGAVVLQRMSVSFAESSWTSVATNVAQAQVHLESTKMHVSRLQELVDQANTKQAEVKKLFGEIDRAHEEAKILIRGVNVTDKRIKGYKDEIGPSLALASVHIQELHDFAQGCLRGVDLTNAQEEERRACASLAAAKIEAQQEKPDFIAALNYSESAYSIAHQAILRIQEKRQASASAELVVAE